ncbi:MAG: Polysaccharide transporter permease protein [Actinomycetia bacterium]|nr:Polysaccharide transporter permease protein [Actinomycetes bacterium]
MTDEARPRKVAIIEPGGSFTSFREVWHARELVSFLTWRDMKVRYAQAVLGLAWALIQPLVLMVLFTVFLGRFAGVRTDDVPYAVFALSGLVPWTFFANGVGGAAESLLTNANLVSKVYFPRLAIPLGVVLSWVPDLLIGSVLLVLFMLAKGVTPAPTVFLLPFIAVLAVLPALGLGALLAALNVKYRDVRYAVPFVLQAMIFATPIVYPATVASPRVRVLFGLNPMAGVIEAYRWAALGQPASVTTIALSAVVTALLLGGGLAYFQRAEATFADVI